MNLERRGLVTCCSSADLDEPIPTGSSEKSNLAFSEDCDDWTGRKTNTRYTSVKAPGQQIGPQMAKVYREKDAKTARNSHFDGASRVSLRLFKDLEYARGQA